MSETITLKESGLVLTMLPLIGTKGGLWNYIDYRAIIGGLQLRIYQGHEGRWYASTPGGGYGGYSTLGEATDALDRMVLALRSALLPPDAVVVRTGDARERVAKATRADLRSRTRWWNSVDADVQDEIVKELSSAVLAALGIGGAS